MKPNMKNIIPLSQTLQRFRDCQRGAVAIIFALAIIPLLVAAGLAVDLSRAYLVKTRLAHSLDAAGLSAGSMRTTSSDTAALEAEFEDFFTANYPDTEIGTTHDLTFEDNGGIITVTGKATVETVFMSIVGIDDITVSASAEIEVETTGLELVLVLDNSLSMDSDSRMDDMQTAALDLLDIIFGDETTPDYLKVGLVPFDQTVNIGTSNALYVSDTSVYNWGWGSDWDGCVMARTYPYDVQDDGIDIGGLWDPFWNEKSSNRNKYCTRPITALTNDRDTLESEINAMAPTGATHINIGAIWGWRVLSPDAPFTEGSNYGDADWNKAAVILTDGENSYFSSWYSAYYTQGGITASELDDRLLEICTNMKAEDIIVYTIAFGTDITTPVASMMESCATDSDKYYESPDSDTLSVAFRAIGAELKQLHLSK